MWGCETTLVGTLGYDGGVTPILPLLPGSRQSKKDGIAAQLRQRRIRVRAFSLTKTGGDNQWAVFNTAFANPLTLTVTSSYEEPVDGGVVSFTPPISGPKYHGSLLQLPAVLVRSYDCEWLDSGPNVTHKLD